MQPVVIRRQFKHEMDQAIKDLLARGFEIVSPPKQMNVNPEQINNYSFEQKRIQLQTFDSPWIAKMNRITE